MSKNNKLQVRVQVPSDHTMEIPKGMDDLVWGLFDTAGLTGDFVLYLGKRERGSAHLKGITVRSEPVGRVIKFRAQPGGNETNHTLTFSVPDGMDTGQVYNDLRSAVNRRMSMGQRARTEKKMRRLYRLTRATDFVVKDLGESVALELGFKSLASLREALTGLANDNIFVFQGSKKDEYCWATAFHQTMKESGYSPEDEIRRDSIETNEVEEQEDEEDRIIVRVYEIDDRLEDIAELSVRDTAERLEAEKRLAVAQNDLSSLLAQVEKANAHMDILRDQENALIVRISELEDEQRILVQERIDLVRRVEELDQEKKLARAEAEAEAVLARLSPDERAVLISRLQAVACGA